MLNLKNLQLGVYKMKNETYAVWVGATEVTDYLVSKEVAELIKKDWIEKGYDDCIIEKIRGLK